MENYGIPQHLPQVVPFSTHSARNACTFHKDGSVVLQQEHIYTLSKSVIMLH